MADDKFLIRLGADVTQLQGDLQKANNTLTGWANKVSSLANITIAGAAVGQIANVTLELSKLAGEAEGVRNAFIRLEGSEKVLMQMKAATGGTVSELALMKAAVQASNFNIPIENLANLFKFATLRAQQTGQSVDYLVESIILGIGRKSPLILDNLGISAVQLREKFKGLSAEQATVGDVAKAVGEIANDSLKNMAGFSENAATKMQQLSAEWTNFKVQLGTGVNNSGFTGGILDLLRLKLIETTDEWDKFKNSLAGEGINSQDFQETLKAFDKWRELTANTIALGPELEKAMVGPWIKANTYIDGSVGAINERIKQLKKSIDDATNNDQVRAIKLKIEIEEEQLEKLMNGSTLHERVAKIQASKLPVANMDFLGQAQLPQIDGLPDKLGAVNIKMKEIGATMQEQINIAPLLSSGIAEIAEGFGTAMVTGAGFGQTIVRAISGFMKSFGQQLIAIGIGKLALDKLFKTPAGGIAAIAAGTALVAASAAMNAAAAKGISSLSSGGSGSYGGSAYDGRASVNGNTQNLTVTGEFRMRGSDLVATVRNAQQDNNILKGS